MAEGRSSEQKTLYISVFMLHELLSTDGTKGEQLFLISLMYILIPLSSFLLQLWNKKNAIMFIFREIWSERIWNKKHLIDEMH